MIGRLLILIGLLLAGQLYAQVPMSGAGRGTSVCVSYTYPAAGYYQSLALTDSWSTQDATLTTNQIVSPSCGVTGAKLVETATTGVHNTTKSIISVIAAQPYTTTVFFNRFSGTRNAQITMFSSGLSSQATGQYILGTCAVQGGTPFTTGSFSAASGTAQITNGWCKATITATLAVDVSMFFAIYMLDAGFSGNYAGDGTSGIYIWGVDIR